MFRQALRSLPRLARATAAGRLEAAQGVSSRRVFSSWSRSALATLVVAGAAASAAATGASLAESPVESSVLVPSIPERAQERTFIMVKPDGVQRGLVSDILGRFEKRGYKLVAIKVVLPTSDLAQKHYAEHEGKPFYPKLVDFLSSGPVVAMVFEGRDAVATGRTMIGASDPIKSAPGTIRADLGVDLGRNVIHGSDGLEAAAREINLWFPEGVITYGITNQGWIYE